jgi:cytochrome P450
MLPEKALPQLSMDPFSDESLAEPYAHHDLLRGAGPVFWLECRGIYGAAGHAEVSVALKDSQPLFSSKDMSLGFEDSCLMLNVHGSCPDRALCWGSTRTRLLRPNSSSS